MIFDCLYQMQPVWLCAKCTYTELNSSTILKLIHAGSSHILFCK